MNDRPHVLPPPGTFINRKAFKDTALFLVVAAKAVRYAGQWTQYEMLAVGGNRVLHFNLSSHAFHEGWDVVHRP